MPKKIVFIVGPTAVGKSSLAIKLAKKFDGEIISADSMAIYKGMDIGTAKPSQRERAIVPHHLIDIIKPSRNYSVFQYYKRAMRKIESIQKRGKLPIVVGGTGLYVRAIRKGIDELPAENKLLRKTYKKIALTKGVPFLHALLLKKNPKRARELKPTDLKRIMRALEIEAAKRKHKDRRWQRAESLKRLGYSDVVIGLTRDRSILYDDINRRVDQMMRKGLLREVKSLKEQKLSKTAKQAVGYKELFDYLDRQCSKRDAVAQIKQNSRHLAKRQWTWFKKEENIRWFDIDKKNSEESIYHFISTT